MNKHTDNEIVRLLKREYEQHDAPPELDGSSVYAALLEHAEKRKKRRIVIRRLTACAATVAVCCLSVWAGFDLLAPEFYVGSKAEDAEAGSREYSQLYDWLEQSTGGSFVGEYGVENLQGNGLPEQGVGSVQAEQDSEKFPHSAGDIVRTDGRYTCVLSDNTLRIYLSTDGSAVCAYVFEDDIEELYLLSGRIAAVYSKSIYITPEEDDGSQHLDEIPPARETGVVLLQLTDGAATLVAKTAQSGSYSYSYAVGGTLFIVSVHTVYCLPGDAQQLDYYVPYCRYGAQKTYCPAENIVYPEGNSGSAYAVIGAHSAASSSVSGLRAVLGSGFRYCSTEDSLFVLSEYAVNSDGTNKLYTRISAFSHMGDGTEYRGSASLLGRAIEGNSLIYSEKSLFVCTSYTELVANLNEQAQKDFANSNTVSAYAVYALNGEDLRVTGIITGLGINQTVHSVRFENSVCSFLCSEQSEPLFTVDCVNPADLKALN